jgi:hypothetical protein
MNSFQQTTFPSFLIKVINFGMEEWNTGIQDLHAKSLLKQII